MTPPSDTTNKERTIGLLDLSSLGKSADFLNVCTSSLQGIREWMDENLPDDIDKENLMVRAKEIRKQAGIIDP